mmetsp:Transcript_12204/g.19839  ORF Transcript_12204/g.19839 Transcript_12204/m.19839 type:complete len:149 (+) Transcript_12204:2-448(+)
MKTVSFLVVAACAHGGLASQFKYIEGPWEHISKYPGFYPVTVDNRWAHAPLLAGPGGTGGIAAGPGGTGVISAGPGGHGGFDNWRMPPAAPWGPVPVEVPVEVPVPVEVAVPMPYGPGSHFDAARRLRGAPLDDDDDDEDEDDEDEIN